MLALDMFGFRALWSPYFMAALAVCTLAFFLITVKYRSQFKDSEPLSVKQGAVFSAAMLLLYAIKGSPLDLLGHIMFSAHMTQMAVLYLVIPPMFIISIPAWIWRKVLTVPAVRKPFAFFTKPLIALLVFNVFFSFYHVPVIFDTVKVNMWYHGMYTVFLFITAVFMWWPVLNSLNHKNELSGLQKVGYIFGNGILLTPACALIIFTKHPLYDTFSDPAAWMQAMALCVPAGSLAALGISGPELLNWLPLLEDQQLGGVLMKIIQEIVYGSMLAHIFFAWYRKENEKNKSETEALYEPKPGHVYTPGS
ncbi:cytochrome c oxidase assembly factor CtaG [Peribacillus sp. SCS-37]|uniref:cytochrome c oxidase assembly factor CtaG n=1 Tax=Paraperibacillus esterisolvens TaxID=3115296 RepID=UPI003906BF6D